MPGAAPIRTKKRSRAYPGRFTRHQRRKHKLEISAPRTNNHSLRPGTAGYRFFDLLPFSSYRTTIRYPGLADVGTPQCIIAASTKKAVKEITWPHP